MATRMTRLYRLAGPLLGVVLPAQGAAAEAVEMAPVRVTVLDPDGKPKRGAVVEVLRFEGGDACYSNLDVGEGDEYQVIAKLPTPKSGSLGMQVPVAIPYRVRVDVPPYAIEWRERVYAGAELTIQLRPGAVVEGIVKNDNGKPIPAEKITLHAPYPRKLRYHSHAGDDGKFRFERLMPGAATVRTESSQGAIHGGHTVTLASGETSRVEVTLDHGAVIRGQVVDAATDEPIEGAVIGVGWTFDKPVTTDKDGRYALIGLGGPYANNLYIRATGYCQQQIPRPKAKTGTVTVDLKLVRGMTVAGRILDAAGKPVEGCYVAVVGMQYTNQQETDWFSTRTDKDGRYSIDDLRRELTPVLLVRHERHATLTMAIPPPGAQKRVTVPDVQLRPRRILRGRLLDSKGMPWAGQLVEVGGNHHGAPARTQKDGGHILASYLPHRTVFTDTLGRFFVGDLGPGTYSLKVGVHERVIEIEAGKDPAPLDLR